MAIKIDRKLNGQDVVEKEFGDFLEKGGSLGGSIFLSEDINLRQKIVSTNPYLELFAWGKEDGVVIDLNNPRLVPKQNSVMKLGDTSWRWKDVYLDGENKNANGYTKLPNGMIMQWGTYIPTVNYDAQYINYPITFPNNCFSTTVAHVSEDSNTNAVETNYSIRPGGNNQFRFRLASTDTARLSNFKIQWMAIGY